MARRRSRDDNGVSLFPFMSILACLIGILTLMISVAMVAKEMDRRGRTQEELDRAIENRDLKKEISALKQERPFLAKRLKELEKELQSRKEQPKPEESVIVRPGGIGSRTARNVFFVECNSTGITVMEEDKAPFQVSKAAIGKNDAYNKFLQNVKRTRDSMVLFLVRKSGNDSYLWAAGWAESKYEVNTGKLPIPNDGKIDLSKLRKDLLDATPVLQVPPPTEVTIPSSRPIPKTAEVYYAIAFNDRVHLIDPVTPLEIFEKEFQRHKREWVHQRTKRQGTDRYIYDPVKIVTHFKDFDFGNSRGQVVTLKHNPTSTRLHIEIKPNGKDGGTSYGLGIPEIEVRRLQEPPPPDPDKPKPVRPPPLKPKLD